jgi:hypothetical protein
VENDPEVLPVYRLARRRQTMTSDSKPGLPDGLFSNQKIPIWVNFGRPYVDGKMLIYFMAFWNILRTFGIFYD